MKGKGLLSPESARCPVPWGPRSCQPPDLTPENGSLCLPQRQRIIARGGRLSQGGLSHLFIFIISPLLLDNETIDKSLPPTNSTRPELTGSQFCFTLPEPLGAAERNKSLLPQVTPWPWKLRSCASLSSRVSGRCPQTWTPPPGPQPLVFKTSECWRVNCFKIHHQRSPCNVLPRIENGYKVQFAGIDVNCSILSSSTRGNLKALASSPAERV